MKYFFLFLFSFSVLVAADDDSTKQYHVDEVVVTGTRSNVFSRKLSSSVAMIDNMLIQTKTGNTFASALQGTSGLFIKSYGGNAMLHTISLRGMSSEHTAILVDGMRINSAQNGSVDLGIFSSSNIERIEILKGGSSSLYGTDAVGGVVHIISKKPKENFSANVFSTVGSYGYRAWEEQIHFQQSEDVRFRASLRNETGKGNYQFYFSDGKQRTLRRRRNADYSLMFFNSRIDWKANENIVAFLNFNVDNAQRGSPNPVTSDEGSARLNDKNVRTNFTVEWSNNSRIVASLHSSFQYGYETYDEPQWGIKDVYVNRAAILEPHIRYVFSKNISCVFGGEFSRSWIQSNALTDATRNQQSVFVSSEISATTFSQTSFESIIYPAIRFDNISDVGNAVSPKLGINIGIIEVPEIRFRSSYGKSFHAPTFNNLYYHFFGNPDLKPERSTSFDAGVVSAFDFFGKIQLEGNYFSIDTRERIVSDENWKLKNFGRVTSEGIEMEGTWRLLEERLLLSMNTTLNAVKKLQKDSVNDATYKKQLRYLPRQTTHLSASYSVHHVTFYVQHSILRERYADEKNIEKLPDVNISTAALLYRFSFENIHPLIKIEASNIFNASYHIIKDYPMPLREFRLSLSLQYQEQK
jgi:outer membrane cobalamin receptor